jgi:hypothetical protein
MNKDMHQIFETYKGTSATKEIIEEGLFDRLKARGAQAVGTVKGLGNQAAGIAKGAIAGAKGNIADVQAAQQQRQAGAAQGDLAKIESYRTTAIKKLDATTQEIFNDLKRLGINLNKIPAKSINAFKNQLNKSFDTITTGIKNPTPQQDEEDEDCETNVYGENTNLKETFHVQNGETVLMSKTALPQTGDYLPAGTPAWVYYMARKATPEQIKALMSSVHSRVPGGYSSYKDDSMLPAGIREDEDCETNVKGVKTRMGLQPQVKPSKFFP